MGQIIAVGRWNSGRQIIEDPRHIKHKPQADLSHVKQILHKHAEVEQDGGKPKTDDEKYNQNRDGAEDIPGYRNAVNNHHRNDNQEGNPHFKGFNTHLFQYQDVLWEIDLGNNRFIAFYNLYAGKHQAVKKVPHR